jgi:hypothetical protein
LLFGNKTGLSIEKFLESPFAGGKHPKLINTGTKAAAAEAAVTAAEAIAVADLEDPNTSQAPGSHRSPQFYVQPSSGFCWIPHLVRRLLK